MNPAVSAVVLGTIGISSLISAQPAFAATSYEITDADTVNLNSLTDLNIVLDNTSADHPVSIRGPVGPRSTNEASDVRKVQERLKDLGFHVDVDGQFGPQTSRALRTFEALVRGSERINDVSGVVRNGTLLHRILESDQAPKWVEMPNSGIGYVNGDRDNHDYGSDHLVKVVEAAGRRYHNEYLTSHPDAAKIATNDLSVKHGGDTPDHQTHENGLDIDLRLPRKDGTHGSRSNWANYDREATFAMLKAFAEDPKVERIIFSDPVMLNRIKAENYDWGHKVFDGGKGHRNHIHIDIAPPTFEGIEGFKAAELLNRRLGPPVII